MNDIEQKIKTLEKQNKEFDKLVKELRKKALAYLWLWYFLPIVGFFIHNAIALKRLSSEPYYSNAIKVKVEIAKNEIEIIKLKKSKPQD